MAASALYSACPCSTICSYQLCLGKTSCYELSVPLDTKVGGTITLVESEGKPDTRWHILQGLVQYKNGS